MDRQAIGRWLARIAKIAVPVLVLLGGVLAAAGDAQTAATGARLLGLAGAICALALGHSCRTLKRVGLAPIGTIGGVSSVILAGASLAIGFHVPALEVVALPAIWILMPVLVLAADAAWLFVERRATLLARAVRGGAICSAAVGAVLWWSIPLLGGVTGPQASSRSGFEWFVAFGGFMVLCHLLVPISMRRERRVRAADEAALGDRALLTLQCPRCTLWMQMHSGMILCPGCRLALRVEFEEPRCDCGYPLHRLSGPNCPECGFEVPPERRWGAARAPAAGVTQTSPPSQA